MKVLHINGNYIWTNLHQLMIRALTKQGTENYVYVPTYDERNGLIKVDDNVVVDECFKKNDRFLYYYKQKKITTAVVRRETLESFDLIHAYTLFTDGNVAMQLSKTYNIPYVVAVRNTDINSFFQYRVLLRGKGIKVLQNASAVFFLSDSYKEQTINQYVPEKYKNMVREKSFVIPNGIDSFWLENIYKDRNYDEIKKRISNKKLRLIFAGTIDKNKNIELTAKAAEALINRGWDIQLTVVGKIVDEEIACRLRQRKSVVMIDKMPKESLIKLYREADIFVMPSHYESFGLVYAEAMSQGLPVIYTRGQGFDNQFSDGEIGLSVNDRDADELAYQIIKISEKYCDISKKCVEKVYKFNWELIAQKYMEIYMSIVM